MRMWLHPKSGLYYGEPARKQQNPTTNTTSNKIRGSSKPDSFAHLHPVPLDLTIGGSTFSPCHCLAGHQRNKPSVEHWILQNEEQATTSVLRKIAASLAEPGRIRSSTQPPAESSSTLVAWQSRNDIICTQDLCTFSFQNAEGVPFKLMVSPEVMRMTISEPKPRPIIPKPDLLTGIETFGSPGCPYKTPRVSL